MRLMCTQSSQEQKPYFHENVLCVFLVIFFQLKQQEYWWQLDLCSTLQNVLGVSSRSKRTSKHELAGMHVQSLLGQPFNSIPKVQVVPFVWGWGGGRPFFPNLKFKCPSCPWEVFIFAQLGANRSTWHSFSGHTFTKWGHSILCRPDLLLEGSGTFFYLQRVDIRFLTKSNSIDHAAVIGTGFVLWNRDCNFTKYLLILLCLLKCGLKTLQSICVYK